MTHVMTDEQRVKNAAAADRYRRQHPERVRAAVDRYQQRYPERVKAQKAAYAKAHPEKVRQYNRAKSAKNSKLLTQIKVERGCFDCGYDDDPDALQFDHVRGEKLGSPSSMTQSTSRMMTEVEKCEVRCANCHAIKSAQDQTARTLKAGYIPRKEG